MTSPFPGMDPYLEAQGHWESFHAALILHSAEALNEELPESYVAKVETRNALVSFDEPISERVPDLLLARGEKPTCSDPQGRPGLATLEPITIPLAKREVEVRERWIEILQLPNMELVTVLEILSPSNKAGTGRADYLAKREAYIDRPVNLVEIDLILRGARMPMERRLPPGDCYAVVARAETRPDADVYAWTIRHPLPLLPIPLKSPDPDVTLDLARVFRLSYDRGRYERIVRYGTPLLAGLPIDADARSWAETVVRAASAAN
jgi:hypothetical protein